MEFISHLFWQKGSAFLVFVLDYVLRHSSHLNSIIICVKTIQNKMAFNTRNEFHKFLIASC